MLFLILSGVKIFNVTGSLIEGNIDSITKTVTATSGYTEYYGNSMVGYLPLYFHYYDTTNNFTLTLDRPLKYLRIDADPERPSGSSVSEAVYIPGVYYYSDNNGAYSNVTYSYIYDTVPGSTSSIQGDSYSDSDALWNLKISSNLKTITFTGRIISSKDDWPGTSGVPNTTSYNPPSTTFYFYY